MASDEDLPDPSDRLTRPEKFLAERLTAYRIFWIKMAFNILIIGSFLWAGTHVQDYQNTAQQVYDKMEELGCYEFSAEERMFEPETRPMPGSFDSGGNVSLDDLEFENSSGQMDPP